MVSDLSTGFRAKFGDHGSLCNHIYRSLNAMLKFMDMVTTPYMDKNIVMPQLWEKISSCSSLSLSSMATTARERMVSIAAVDSQPP